MSWMFWCPCGGEVAAGGKAPPGGGECLACGRIFEAGASVAAAGGAVAHLCTRGRPRRAERCQEEGCSAPMVALCDEPVGGRRTCDRRVCARHRTGVGDNRDRCPAHAPQARLVP